MRATSLLLRLLGVSVLFTGCDAQLKSTDARTPAAAAIDDASQDTQDTDDGSDDSTNDRTAEVLAPAPATLVSTAGLAALNINGRCARPTQSVQVFVGSDPVAAGKKTASCTTGSWSSTLDLSGADDGVVTLSALFLSEKGDVETTKVVNVVKDTMPPGLTLLGLDPFVKRGSTVPAKITAHDTASGLASLTYSMSLDGTTYAPPTALPLDASAFNLAWPANTTSTTNARIKLIATDAAGNTSSLISHPVHVAAAMQKLLGTYDSAADQADGDSDAARFAVPLGLATDGTYLYVGTYQSIRRVAVADGTTETLIGVYGGTATATDGTGVGARVGSPYGLTVLGDYLYFLDSTFHVLRRVGINPAHSDFRTTVTVAGAASTSGTADHASVGTNARFNAPRGLTTDGTFLYICDTSNNSLRRFDPTTTAVTTVAGSTSGAAGTTNAAGTSARFNSPWGCVYDDSMISGTQGSIYITESNNLRVRRYNIADGDVTDLAGSGHSGSLDGTAANASFRSPRGVTTDGDYLYLTDMVAHVIRRVALNGGAVTTYAGVAGDGSYVDGARATSKFNQPVAIQAAAGNLYVADQYNHVIRKIDMTGGTVSRLAGAPIGMRTSLHPSESSDIGPGALLEGAWGITTTDGNDIYFTASNSLRKLSISSNTVTTIAGTGYATGVADGTGGAASFRSPRGIVKVGSVYYITDQNAGNIRKYDPATGAVTTFAGSTTGVGGYTDADGTAARFNQPFGITTDGTKLYVADAGNHRIRSILLASPYTVTTVAGGGTGTLLNHATGTSAAFNDPRAVVYANNKLYVADSANHVIRTVDLATSGNPVATVAGAYPTATAGSADGAGTAARFNTPYALAVSGSYLYIGDTNNNLIRRLDMSTNQVTTFAGGATLGATHQNSLGRNMRLVAPVALAVGNSKLFVTFNGYGLISSIDLATKEQVAVAGVNWQQRFTGRQSNGHRDGVAAVATVTHRSASCVAADATKIYVIDHVGTIRSFQRDMTDETVVAGAIDQPGSVDGNGSAARVHRAGGCVIAGNYLYFTQLFSNTFRRLNLTTHDVQTIAGDPSTLPTSTNGVGATARFDQPASVEVIGNFAYITEAGVVIRKVNLGTLFGLVTTLAGQYGTSGHVDGVGATARFAALGSLNALAGKLYTIDRTNLVLRSIDPTTGEVATVAGTAGASASVDGQGVNARFTAPYSATSDGVNLWIFDLGTYRLRRYRPDTGAVETVFGVNYTRRGGDYGDVETAPLAGERVTYIPGLGLVFPNIFATNVLK